jgi:FkbM family methyltransferase
MKGHPPIHGNRNVGFLVIKFVLAIAISYLVYAQTIAKNGGGDTSPPSSSYEISAETDLGVDGGFCTSNTISCPIGNTHIREAFRQAPEAADVARSNPTNRFITVRVDDDDDIASSFKMLIRDPRFDTFISGFLFVGRKHDPKVHDLLVRCLRRRRLLRNNDDDPVFIDVGANIGYFTATALALGARTISFEPSYDNAGALMSTIEENGWGDNSTLYMNALGYESNRVTMKSTSHAINKSNMHITGSECVSKSAYGGVNRHISEDGVPALYGIDYMDGVSLDQVMLSNHRNIRRVSLMKIDVETYEIHVLNGAMYSLCNLIVERIVVEVEYLKPSYNLANSCDFDRLRRALALMKYQIFDLEENISYESMELQNFPTDIMFKLHDITRSPADQFRGSMENPCAKFDLNLKMK